MTVFKNLTFETVTQNNLDLIVDIQTQIFPNESARQNYIDTLEKNPYRKEIANWLVYDQDKPIGIVGFYSYHEYPQTAWLGWFGVLEKERGKGYGSAIFDFFIEYAKKRGYTEARLYTDKLSNIEALDFYKHKGMTAENYTNERESKEVTDSTLLFSLSLTDKPIERWNNKYLELNEQLEKQG